MDDVRRSAKAESIPVGLWVIALVALAPFPISALLCGSGPPALMRPALASLLGWSAVVPDEPVLIAPGWLNEY